MSDPIFPLAVWQEGTLENDVPANDNSLRVEALSREVLAVANSPSVSTDGTVYIVGSAPTGAFSTFDEDDLTIYYGGTWYAWAPVTGIVVNLAGSLYAWDAGWSILSGGSGSPGGSDTQVQFNDGGAFGGDSGLTFNKTTNALTQGGALNEAKGSNIASAGTTDIGAATGTLVHVTGTTTITALGTIQAGTRRVVVFDGILTLTHNGTSLILPTGANITTAANDAAVFVSEGSGNWRCVGYMRADGSALAGGAGLTGFTSSLATASPNNTVNASRLIASGGTTNQDAVFSPKGTGAIQAVQADNAASGGNKRGSNAVDWQVTRSTAARVASGFGSTIGGGDNNGSSGQYSTVAGGINNNVSGNNATASGSGNTVAGNNATAFGSSNSASNTGSSAIGVSNTSSGSSSVALGDNNTASGTGSVATGSGCTASSANSMAQGQFSSTSTISGMAAYASGRFSGNGDAQEGKYILRSDTSNATPEAMTTTNAAASTTNQIILQNNSAFAFDGIIVARSSAEWKTWRISGGINRAANAASTALGTTAATVTVMDSTAGAAAWAIAVTADTTNGGLKVECTGAAATSIKWVATVRTAEVIG